MSKTWKEMSKNRHELPEYLEEFYKEKMVKSLISAN